MTDLLIAILITASAASIAFTVWQSRSRWQQFLWRDLRTDLERHHQEVLKNCRQIQNRLDRHDLTLRYLARRLS